MPIIGIDYTPAYEQGGGIGRYVRELIAALARLDQTTPYKLFVSGIQPGKMPDLPGANFAWRTTPITPKWFARLWHRAQIPLPVETFTGRIDLFHATDFTLPPTRSNVRTLLTVHDLSFVRVPETASPTLKIYLDEVVPRSVRRADHVLADSQATKDDLIALYNTPADKITVLLSGVEARFKRVEASYVRQKYQISERPYILSVGTVQPRKNYSRLIKALAALRVSGHDIGLVIVGGKGWLEDPIYQTIQATGMSNYIQLTGFADDADLPALYSGALLTALPSLYEGFGIPVLESMACGTPVLTSNVSSLPEVAGDAAIMVNPTDQEAITGALERMVNDAALRAELARRGLEQVKRFTWEAAAKQLHRIYQQMLN